MDIEFNEDYPLKDTNYSGIICSKSQIVLCNSMSSGMEHVNRWLNRIEGTNKATTPFTVDLNGVIYKHYDPLYYSDIVGVDKYNRHMIGITLENEGYLKSDGDDKVMVNWIGSTYKRKAKIFNKNWRDKSYWAPYSKKQLDSLYKLCEYLSIEFDIQMEIIGHNTELSTPDLYEGILSRSNFSKYFFDVSPAFDFRYFNNKLDKLKKK